MKIYIREITSQETVLEFSQDHPWVQTAVRQVDENSDRADKKASERLISVRFNLRKVDEVIVVEGSIDTHIELLCSRCANGFSYPCHPRFSALFCKDPVMAGVAHLPKNVGDYGSHPLAHANAKPVGQNRGFARHAHDPEDDDAVLAGKDIDITYLSRDFIDLNEVLSEQLQFQIPFQPLCEESCKGVCSQCGADWNRGRCACARITSMKPFSVLRDFKV